MEQIQKKWKFNLRLIFKPLRCFSLLNRKRRARATPLPATARMARDIGLIESDVDRLRMHLPFDRLHHPML
ncbi:hypothetical protein [Ruegeria sp. 6PALISEP08]|uniref:hypothetical protein n=1 Tax=Ruegeria sp. 6PALISEP08 TaxID=1225660 RepID=UPI000A9EDA47|nr:hypothetical protein [Ruegeria sp. 6PALISEP08]